MYNAPYSSPPPRQLPDPRVNSPMQRGQPSPASTSPLVRERSLRSRYSPYPSSIVAHRKGSAESMSLDVPSISLHDPASDSRSGGRLPGDEIKLPPIQPLAPPRHVSNPSYALPPISALEDLRGVSSQDSAAVLERLKMEDVASDASGTRWPRHRSLSVSMRPSHSFPTPASWSSDPVRTRARYEPTSVSSPEFSPTQHSSREGSSAGAISPVSPTTPRSTEVDMSTLKCRVRQMDGPGQMHYISDHSDHRVLPTHHHGAADYHRTNSEGDYHRKNVALSAGPDRHLSSRHVLESDESEVEHVRRPIRPW